MAHRSSDIGPSAPWYEDDGIEYVGDSVLFEQTVDEVVARLVDTLEARIEKLHSGDLSLAGILDEIRDQMTVASAQGHFGEARELHDLALALLLAEDSAKRAV
jgi:hypothetical protein